MTVELDRDDLVNLIIGCSGPYYTIMDKYNEKGLNLGHDEEMAQFIVDYFEYIYGKRGEEE